MDHPRDHDRDDDHESFGDHVHKHIHEHMHDYPHGPGFGGHGFGGRGARGPWSRWGAERGGWGGRRRMRRGDIRTAVLVALRDGPANGYEVMRRLEEMSGGLWRPSPGSVYPHLQMLEESGVVESDQSAGSRTYTLTEAGRAEAEQASLPFERRQDGDDELRTLRLAVHQLVDAAKQLSGAGSQGQIERGIAAIQGARKQLYQILAED
jgi:DNA-binding PadR family transcriptional regulator